MARLIISESPGHVIYQGPTDSHVLYYFTDVYAPEGTRARFNLPGKGALCQRISSFFFSKINQLGFSSHFVKSLNMRESLMTACKQLAFDIKIHFYPTKDFSKDFGIEKDAFFDPAIFEYVHKDSGKIISDSFILAFDFLDQEGLETLQLTALRLGESLKAMFMGFGLILLGIRLSFGRVFSEEGDDRFILMGEMSPDVFSVMDLETKNIFGEKYVEKSKGDLEKMAHHYRFIADKIGIYLEGLQKSCILNFKDATVSHAVNLEKIKETPSDDQ